MRNEELKKFLSSEEIQEVGGGKKLIDYRKEKGPFSERNLYAYLDYLDLDIENLEGQKILDVGPSLEFLRAAKTKNLDVTGVDASVRPNKREDDKLVYGSGQFLPFKEGRFDLVLANNSVPLHVPHEDDVSGLLSIYEMLRVAKKEVRIIPFTPDEVFEREGKIFFGYDFDRERPVGFYGFNLKDLLEKAGINYEIRFMRGVKPEDFKPKPWLPPGYEKEGGQFVILSKNEKSDLSPILDEIKALIKKQQEALKK